MEITLEVFDNIYRKHFAEMLLPVLQDAMKTLCGNGGDIWDYISGLVVQGVHRYVYGAYENEEPYYIRRGSSGGLGDPNNVVINISDGTIDGDYINFSGEMINVTPPGITDASDGGGGGGGSLEDQVIGGYGYRYPLPKHNHYRGDFHPPRNFYQVYEEEYDPERAWGMVLSKIQGVLPEIHEKALDAAISEIISLIT